MERLNEAFHTDRVQSPTDGPQLTILEIKAIVAEKITIEGWQDVWGIRVVEATSRGSAADAYTLFVAEQYSEAGIPVTPRTRF